MAIGFTLPFMRSTGSLGFFETTNTSLEATRDNLKSLLLTNWGERPMHYFLGCNFKEFMFENMDADTFKRRVADRIFDQVETWLPFVEITTLNVVMSDEDATVPENGFGIRIVFGIKGSPDLTSKFDIAITA